MTTAADSQDLTFVIIWYDGDYFRAGQFSGSYDDATVMISTVEERHPGTINHVIPILGRQSIDDSLYLSDEWLRLDDLNKVTASDIFDSIA